MSPVRWGIGDFCWIYFGGLVASFFGAAVGAAINGPYPEDSTPTAIYVGSFVGMYSAYTFGIWFVSKHKGRGSPALDFGVRAKLQYWWALPAGAALQIALGAFVYPLIWLADNEKQDIVDQLNDASGAKRAVLIVAAGLLAPIFEEILFRGLLLRALRRRLPVEPAIAIQAVIFAFAHPLGDPSLGTLAIVPALFALGVISGIAAVRIGDLSVSIPLHMGFNLLTLIALVALIH